MFVNACTFITIHSHHVICTFSVIFVFQRSPAYLWRIRLIWWPTCTVTRLSPPTVQCTTNHTEYIAIRCDCNKPTSSNNNYNRLHLELKEYFLHVAAFHQVSVVLCDSWCDFWKEEWSDLFFRWGGLSSPPLARQPVDRKLFGIMEQLHQRVCEAPSRELFCDSPTWRVSWRLVVSSCVIVHSVCQQHLKDLSVR